jgi:hypothetical protein
VVVHSYNSSYSRNRDREDGCLRPAQAKKVVIPCLNQQWRLVLGKNARPNPKKNYSQKGPVVWLNWHLPSKYEVLSSNPSTLKKKRKRTLIK